MILTPPISHQLKMMFQNLNKKAAAALTFILLSPAVFSEDLNTILSEGISPEQAVEKLLSAEDVSEQEYRERLIAAAEIKQISGELSEAADLFKKASLAVKGSKDFNSLYRAALIRVETADYRSAEADIRAILTFSDDLSLRIKANILLSRLKMYQGYVSDALTIISEILSNNIDLTPEAYYWSSELAESYLSGSEFESFMNIYKTKNFDDKTVYNLKNRIPTPDSVFGLIQPGSDEPEHVSAAEPEKPAPQTEQGSNINISIQIGSFLRIENAEDLKKTVSVHGFTAEIRQKTVNGKEYNVVVIPVNEDDIQSVIIKLKEKGFEGYPLY